MIELNDVALFSSDEPLSLYLHIPFCARKCGYCDFYSKSSTSDVELFINGLEKEIELYQSRYPNLKSRPINTIFIGGGTPSILSVSQWKKVADLIHNGFDLTDCFEWTIEVNPESFTTEKAEAWLQSGVTRLSMGVQSLDPIVLKEAERIHTAETVRSVLSNPILEKFDSISCDCIYGLPSQTLESLESTLDELLSFPILQHISAYELTIAESTPFAFLPDDSFPDDEFLADYEDIVLEKLESAGFERYEVSNYAKNGKVCSHNNAYWSMKPYFGLGPSAHSFDGVHRFSNVASLNEYINLLGKETLPLDNCEALSTEMITEEYLFLALRTSNGISISDFEMKFGISLLSGSIGEKVESLVESGVLLRDETRIYLSTRGLNIADGVALKLFAEH